ncbi:restriction endonuclease subunit S [Brenneria tiliae]|uniref:Restriction endonuclease subunit S n=1 Tax=Brenneria tiliae TaxID=2914984 RepID=A0ABT0MU96_9GAMM|nr:restriction endonuclease subunit S [Brenneria tiliae]MCL2893122.1 restriction endonuclease subunit S [Brenneria tiliae]
MSWPSGRVSDIAEVISGFAFKSEWFGTGKAKVIRIGDLKNGRIDINGAATFDENANQVREQFIIRRGDILMALSGATVGKTAVADSEAEGAYLNQRVAIIRGKCHENTEYLKYVFSGSLLKKLLLNAGGAAQPNLSPKDLAVMEIPLPPLPEQKRIAGILGKIDAISRKRQLAAQRADELLRAVFLDRFGDPETKGWEFTTVGNMAAKYKGSMRTGPFGSDLKHSEFISEGISVLGIDNAVNNTFKWGKERFISQEKYEQLKRYTVNPGDVLITIMGTCGRCAVVPDDIPLAINTKHLCCITLDKNKCLPSFLHTYFLVHPISRRYLGQVAKGAIMDGLNLGMIKEMPIPIVPINEQKKYEAISIKVAQLIANQNEGNEATKKSFLSISQKAFSGKL